MSYDSDHLGSLGWETYFMVSIPSVPITTSISAYGEMCVLCDTTCDKICHKLEAGLCFSPVSSICKTDQHKTIGIFLKVVLKVHTPNNNLS